MNVLKAKIDKKQPISAGVILFDHHAQLDVYGSLEMLTAVNYKRQDSILIQTVALHETNLAIGPTPFTLADILVKDVIVGDLDFLLIPGGIGVDALLLEGKADLLAALWKLASQCTLVCTISEGSLLIAGSPLLCNQKATTLKSLTLNTTMNRSHASAPQRFPQVQWQPNPQWVSTQSGQVITASGVSAGLDMIHWMIGEWFGSRIQQKVCDMAEYEAPTCGTTDQLRDPFAGMPQPSSKDPLSRCTKPLSMLFVLYDSFEMMDTFGPLEMFQTCNRILPGNISITTTAESPVVKSVCGPKFRVDKVFAEVDANKESYDFLFVPGGVGTLRELHNPSMAHFLSSMSSCSIVMTVCTGANVIATATKWLKGRRATCNKLSFRLMTAFSPDVEWIEQARWVKAKTSSSRVIYTSSGVSAGTDLALAVLQDLHGEDTAQAVANMVEYRWNTDPHHDPFAHTIPSPNYLNRMLVILQTTLLKGLYKAGMALGYPMYKLAPTLVGV